MEKDIQKQNLDRRDNIDPNESDDEDQNLNPTLSPIDENIDVGLDVDPCDDIDLDEIALEIIQRYSLNRKQRYAFELAIKNVIKRERNEETEQILGYVGGPGGTGKSQVIKAVVDFHKEINAKGKLKMCAYTGTAAKHIGGSTTATYFGFATSKISALENRFANVNTIIIDEVSMIGCRQLNKISKCLTKAKHANPDLPFGGVDIIFLEILSSFLQLVIFHSILIGMMKQLQLLQIYLKINKKLGQHLWRQVNHVVLLDEQMRVTDRPYQELLNRLREGKCTDSDIEMLNKRVVGNSCS